MLYYSWTQYLFHCWCFTYSDNESPYLSLLFIICSDQLYNKISYSFLFLPYFHKCDSLQAQSFILSMQFQAFSLWHPQPLLCQSEFSAVANWVKTQPTQASPESGLPEPANSTARGDLIKDWNIWQELKEKAKQKNPKILYNSLDSKGP